MQNEDDDAGNVEHQCPEAFADEQLDRPTCEGAAPVDADESLSPTTSVDPAYGNRRKRIVEHRIEAQVNPNTTIAFLAGVNSDLLDCELDIAETLRQGLATGGNSLDVIERYAGLIDVVVRLSKQIAQITQLERQTRRDGGEREKQV